MIKADILYIRDMRERTARYAMPLPALFGMTAGIVGLLVFLTIVGMSGL